MTPGKLLLLGIPFLLTSVFGAEQESILPALPPEQKWKLVWGDEFGGTQIDGTKWESPENPRKGAFWTTNAVSLDGEGNLVIRTYREGDQCFAGCLRSKDRFVHTFGYYEARMQFPKHPGHWPAFWLFSPDVLNDGNEGRDGTEIDIMEKPWIDDFINHALHWDGYGKDHKKEGLKKSVPGISAGWRTAGLNWTTNEYVFYVDGKETWRTRAGGVCQVPLFVQFTEEADAKAKRGWTDGVAAVTQPDRFIVDYVRVFDLVDAQTAKPVMIPQTVLPAFDGILNSNNLIKNPGFELTGEALAWRENNFGKHEVLCEQDKVNPHSGMASQKISLHLAGSGLKALNFEQRTTLRPGATVEVRFWAHGTGANKKPLGFSINKYSKAPPFTAYFKTGAKLTPDWKEFVHQVTLPREASGDVRVIFQMEEDGSVWIDDVSIKEIEK